MRIISGKYRGLTLAEFKGDDIRPTADRVKESLFNILYDQIAGATVLDLFCGSGNLGIECISRGASDVHFNDFSKASLEVLKKNLAKLKGESGYRITANDYIACLEAAKGSYDIIFIDPPYRFDYGAKALKIIAERGLLKSGGVAVFEWDKSLREDITGLEKYDERKYGKTYLNFYKVDNN
jgi:16S rRNA (guanine(966)-N(2))-methyltransferase RsmD